MGREGNENSYENMADTDGPWHPRRNKYETRKQFQSEGLTTDWVVSKMHRSTYPSMGERSRVSHGEKRKPKNIVVRCMTKL
jgi:hypothetical protein